MNKKKVVTIFEGIENVHLIKDVGMIPLTLQKEYGYAASVLAYSDKNYPYKDVYYSMVDFPLIKYKKRGVAHKITILKWLFFNAKKYSVLHLYFFSMWTGIYIWLYKLVNKNGLVYVHCDTDGESFLNWKAHNKLKRFIAKKLLFTDKNLEDVLWGIQHKKNCGRLAGTWPFYNMRYVPNGVWWGSYKSVEYNNRDNVLLTVARNGTKQKNTELLLEGFAAIADEFPEWKLELAGTVEKNFYRYIEKFFNRNPGLRKRVIFLGAISDREKLYEVFSNAKVFCLTSRWEGFPLVMVEALSCGCYVIASDISPNKDATQDGKYGSLFQMGNLNAFIEQLRSNLSDEQHMKKVSEEAKIYAENNFTWKKCLEPVNEWICKRQGEMY